MAHNLVEVVLNGLLAHLPSELIAAAVIGATTAGLAALRRRRRRQG
jgi:hypothetical protein